ncbi:hypothetical protein CA13_53230 [Planctomycetes bacterium CA13]|uniref:Bacterial membrane protein YfhO n=1 Tax=Novipirellula herctigrandis TaxID=2527986 RepID=A0A5C5Z9H7_9BACT|nr:hypothetical protein CA13_53230 [Planctomycetes bacterium CA13]
MNWRDRLSVLVLPAIIVLLFATALMGIDRLAFRDVSHFYTPLYNYVAERTSRDWFPMWNPLDQTGIPLVGETTTAVFYPIRYLLFALPIASDVAMSLYVVVHFIIAAFSARYAARRACIAFCTSKVGDVDSAKRNTTLIESQPQRAKVSAVVATIGGMTYALSGSVLFLYSNPPFLVGAAWLPIVLSTWIDGNSKEGRKARLLDRILVSGTAMAMMILGGDPQTALHAVIVGMAVAMVRGVAGWKKDAGETKLSSPPATETRQRRFRDSLVSIILGCLLAVTLSLPQIAASVSWSGQSDRVMQDDSHDWLAPPPRDSKRARAFQFSVAPWHAIELVTPNASGSMLPNNHRFSLLIPGEGRTWTPTVYMSALVVIALICQLASQTFWRPRPKLDVWIVIAITAWFVAMGHFGLVWIIQNASGKLQGVDSAVGGLYWWLYQFLPGYDSLRYPAKWLPIVACSLSIVMAKWLDQVEPESWVTIRRVIVLLVTTAAALFVSATVAAIFPDSFGLDETSTPADRFWGPLNIQSALVEIQYSLVHTIVVLIGLGGIFFAWSKGKLSRPAATRLLIVIVALDLSISTLECGLIAKVHREQELQILTTMKTLHHAPKDASFAMRTRSGNGWPDHWKTSESDQRLIETEASMRAAWFGRWHLLHRQAVLNNMTSIQSESMARFWDATREVTASMTPSERSRFWDSIRAWLAITSVVQVSDESELITVDKVDYAIVKVRHYVRASQALKSIGLVQRQDGLQQDDDFEHLLRSIASGTSRPTVAQATVEIIERGPDSETLLASCDEPCMLVRNVYQDGHWKAQLTSTDDGQVTVAAVKPVEFLKQGVEIPAGDWKIEFDYAPWWLKPSMLVCLGAWLSCLKIVVSKR